MANLYGMISSQLGRASRRFNISPATTAILNQPRSSHRAILRLPGAVEGDDDRMYAAYRVQHNNTLGPYKGGIRFHNDVSMEECTALASWMTYKCALHNLPLGGGKGGVEINPRLHTDLELEELARQYIDRFGEHIGESKDIPAPDVGTGPRIMDVMNAHLSKTTGHICNFTGKTIGLGGSDGRTEATGLGVAYSLELWADANNIDLAGKTFTIQGFGNVGSYAARYLCDMGMILTCVVDHSGSVYSKTGIDAHALSVYVEESGGVDGFDKYTAANTEGTTDLVSLQSTDYDDIWDVECDVLIPAALEQQITAKNAHRIKCMVVVEAANGPVDISGETILNERGIDVLPDIFVNSGGVVVSNFEYISNMAYTKKTKCGDTDTCHIHAWNTYHSHDIKSIHGDMKLTMLQTFRKMSQCRKDEPRDTYRDVCYGIAIRNIERKIENVTE